MKYLAIIIRTENNSIEVSSDGINLNVIKTLVDNINSVAMNYYRDELDFLEFQEGSITVCHHIGIKIFCLSPTKEKQDLTHIYSMYTEAMIKDDMDTLTKQLKECLINVNT
ncbi:hypothetical protein TCON_1040 [Astathelohania contejeani]|uniref:Uncharacterized protein n=1 Tax=Astathelohania contejeani TaxID=164912 RepID=A0ABQ7HZZ9_9MICR|nr:hypothetical protein TCON_1040 [Thelohania contejeani]